MTRSLQVAEVTARLLYGDHGRVCVCCHSAFMIAPRLAGLGDKSFTWNYCNDCFRDIAEQFAKAFPDIYGSPPFESWCQVDGIRKCGVPHKEQERE